MSTFTTLEQRHKIHHIMQTQWSVQAAKDSIFKALGGTDVGDEYIKTFDAILEDLEDDLADVWEQVNAN